MSFITTITTTDDLAPVLYKTLTNNPMPDTWETADESFRERAYRDARRVEGYVQIGWPFDEALAVVYVERKCPLPNGWDDPTWRQSGRDHAAKVLALLGQAQP